MTAPILYAQWPAPEGVIAGTTTRAGSEADVPGQPVWLKQVHRDHVVQLGTADFALDEPEADACIGTSQGDTCVVRTADCLPVLLCARDGGEIAAAHAGWRGLAMGVVDSTVDKMAALPGDLLAWLGPAITQPNFEVGDEVRTAFAAAGFAVENRFQRNSRGRWQADLFGLAKDRLQAIGVTAIYGKRICTFADTERFYSFRRDGETGRLLSFIHRA